MVSFHWKYCFNKSDVLSKYNTNLKTALSVLAGPYFYTTAEWKDQEGETERKLVADDSERAHPFFLWPSWSSLRLILIALFQRKAASPAVLMWGCLFHTETLIKYVVLYSGITQPAQFFILSYRNFLIQEDVVWSWVTLFSVVVVSWSFSNSKGCSYFGIPWFRLL